MDKISWTPEITWVSRKFVIKECGGRLSDTVAEFNRKLESVGLGSHAPACVQDPQPESTQPELTQPESTEPESTQPSTSADKSDFVEALSYLSLSRRRRRRRRGSTRYNPWVRPRHTIRKPRPMPTGQTDQEITSPVGLGLLGSEPNYPDEETLKILGLDKDRDLGLGFGTCLIKPRPRPSVGLPSTSGLGVEQDLSLGVGLSDDDIWKTLPQESCLETIKIKLKEVDENQFGNEEPAADPRVLKYGTASLQGIPKFDPNQVADLVPNKTVVVVVRVYWPFRVVKTKFRQLEPKFCQQIVMLGDQTLDRLRDLIMCVADTVVPGECSQNPRNVPDHTAKDVYKSGFIFIGDTFYNDFRHPDNIDYSEVIRKWAAEKNIAQFDTYAMEGTKMEDLTVQLGYPYVYQHQGNCEHLLAISDVRLLSESEARSSTAYPYVMYHSDRKAKVCFVCGRFAARWLTKNNERVPFDPCYFCDKCYHSFNYVDGKKVGNFEAYYFKEPIYTA